MLWMCEFEWNNLYMYREVGISGNMWNNKKKLIRNNINNWSIPAFSKD